MKNLDDLITNLSETGDVKVIDPTNFDPATESEDGVVHVADFDNIEDAEAFIKKLIASLPDKRTVSTAIAVDDEVVASASGLDDHEYGDFIAKLKAMLTTESSPVTGLFKASDQSPVSGHLTNLDLQDSLTDVIMRLNSAPKTEEARQELIDVMNNAIIDLEDFKNFVTGSSDPNVIGDDEVAVIGYEDEDGNHHHVPLYGALDAQEAVDIFNAIKKTGRVEIADFEDADL